MSFRIPKRYFLSITLPYALPITFLAICLSVVGILEKSASASNFFTIASFVVFFQLCAVSIPNAVYSIDSKGITIKHKNVYSRLVCPFEQMTSTSCRIVKWRGITALCFYFGRRNGTLTLPFEKQDLPKVIDTLKDYGISCWAEV